MNKQGYRDIPEQITAENPFTLSERGWWKGQLGSAGWKIVD